MHAAGLGLGFTISAVAALARSTLAGATHAITMTTFQKAVIGAALAAALGIAVYEARQVSALRSRAQEGQLRQEQLSVQLEQIARERDDATNRLAALMAENERLQGNSAELLRLRGKVTQLETELNQRPKLAAPNRSLEDELGGADTKTVIGRINFLKKRLKEMPAQNIPEIQMLTESDWLNIAGGRLGPRLGDLEAAADIRRALASIRDTAKSKFARRLGNAVNSYAQANGGQLPAAVSQLQPYLDAQTSVGEPSVAPNRFGIGGPPDLRPKPYAPVDAAVLERYQMIATGNVNDLQTDQPVIAEIRRADEQLDKLFQVGLNNYAGYGVSGSNLIHGSWASSLPDKEPTALREIDSLIGLPVSFLETRMQMRQSPTVEELEAYRRKKLAEINEQVDRVVALRNSSTNR